MPLACPAEQGAGGGRAARSPRSDTRRPRTHRTRRLHLQCSDDARPARKLTVLAVEGPLPAAAPDLADTCGTSRAVADVRPRGRWPGRRRATDFAAPHAAARLAIERWPQTGQDAGGRDRGLATARRGVRRRWLTHDGPSSGRGAARSGVAPAEGATARYAPAAARPHTQQCPATGQERSRCGRQRATARRSVRPGHGRPTGSSGPGPARGTAVMAEGGPLLPAPPGTRGGGARDRLGAMRR